MADLDYTTIDNPYNNSLIRGDALSNNFSSNVSQDELGGGGAIKSGGSLSDITINNFIKSRSYQPKKQGFLIDAMRGYIECMQLYVGDGGIIGGSIDIPDKTSTASFHVDSSGNMWSGAPTFLAANFSVTSGGVLDVTGGSITGGTITGGTITGGAITGGTIDGTTITGGTIQTSSSGTRIVLEGANNRLSFINTPTTPYGIIQGYENGPEYGIELKSVNSGFVDHSYMELKEDSTNSYIIMSTTRPNGSASGNGYFNLQSINGASSVVYLQADDVWLGNGTGFVGFVNDIGSGLRPKAAYDIGTGAQGWGDLYVQGIYLGGNYRNTWPSAGASTLSALTIDVTKSWAGFGITNFSSLSFNTGGQIKRSTDVHLEFNAANIDCYRNFVPKTSAMNLNIGSSGQYWNEVFANNYRGKSTIITVFDAYDDIKLIKGLKTKKHKNKDILDFNSFPKEVKVKNEFFDMGALHGLTFGTLRQLVERLEQLEDRVAAVE